MPPYTKTAWVDDSAPFIEASHLNNMEDGIEGANDAIDTHIGLTAAAHAASAISFNPAAGITATDVQAAIEAAAAMGGGGTVDVPWVQTVTQHGADPTGAADSLAAFQAAEAELNATNGGIIVLDGGATYKLSSKWQPTHNNIIVVGNNATLLRGGTDIILDMSGTHATTTTTNRLTRFRAYDLNFDGNGSTGGSANPLVRCYYTLQNALYNIRLSNANSVGIQAVEAWDSYFTNLRTTSGMNGNNMGNPVVLLMSSEPQYRARLGANFVAGTDTTITVKDGTLLPSAGTLTFDDGLNSTTFTWTAGGVAGNVVTGTTGGSTGVTYLAGSIGWGPDVTTGMGHSADNTNNFWFENLHLETWKDGGVWMRGAVNRNVNKIRMSHVKLESRLMRDRAHHLWLERVTDLQVKSINTDTGEFDTGSTLPTDHIKGQRCAMIDIQNHYAESISVAAASARTYASFTNCGNVTYRGKFSGSNTGGANNPTVAGVEMPSCTGVALAPAQETAWTFNPASVNLWGSLPSQFLPDDWQTLTWSASVTPNLSAGRTMAISPTAAWTLNNPTAGTDGFIYQGMVINFLITNNGTAWAITWGSQYKKGTFTPSATGISSIQFVWNGSAWVKIGSDTGL